jgi:hypothetical protein
MIQTTLIPDSSTIHITIPTNYIGKKMHALLYIEEEITQPIPTLLTQKPSAFFGTLSQEAGAEMHLHAIKTREEWNRDI